MDYGHTKKSSMHFNYELGLGNATLLQLAFLEESDPNFSWEKFPLGQQIVQNTKYNYSAVGYMLADPTGTCRRHSPTTNQMLVYIPDLAVGNMQTSCSNHQSYARLH